jgi:hypothetical protein
VVGTPQDPTLNFLTWAVPLGGVVIGIGVAGLLLLNWRSGRNADARAAGGEPVDEADATYTEDDDYRARLERELRMKE